LLLLGTHALRVTLLQLPLQQQQPLLSTAAA
jgi:hypothetical protein